MEIRIAEHTLRRADADIVLDMGADECVVGIEIMDASKRVDLSEFSTVEFRKTA